LKRHEEKKQGQQGHSCVLTEATCERRRSRDYPQSNARRSNDTHRTRQFVPVESVDSEVR
jgi:hypothetical protein